MAEAATVSPEVPGGFRNPWLSNTWLAVPSAMPLFIAGGIDFFVHRFRPYVPSQAELDRKLPVHKPVFPEEPNPKETRATWLGHASVLFQVDGARVLCDPVFSLRCSPVSFAGPKRFRPPPCKVDDLPQLDAVVISHTHYDHLDYNTVLALHKRFPQLQWLVPKGCKEWLQSCGPENVKEQMWWEEAPLGEREDFRIVFTPTQHWSGRGLFDRNKCLWGSWAIIGPEHRAWFAGDTGYCPVFTEIGSKFGPFDIAAIPIGAYCPRNFMGPQHVDPEEAVKIHQDVLAKVSLAIHWGTFPLAFEPVLEPPEKLRDAVSAAGLQTDSFVSVMPGQGLVVAPDGKLLTE